MFKRTIPLLAVAIAYLGPVMAADMSRCLKIEDSDQRTACFSEVYSQSRAETKAKEEEEAARRALDNAPPKLASGWEEAESYNEMDESQSYYVLSPETNPTKQMQFPYADVSAKIGIGCNGIAEWAYLVFSSNPNLTDAEIKSGSHSVAKAVAKWDDTFDDVSFSQEIGSRFLHFSDAPSVIKHVRESDRMLLELQWYGEGRAVFPFSLEGSASTIAYLRSLCAEI